MTEMVFCGEVLPDDPETLDWRSLRRCCKENAHVQCAQSVYCRFCACLIISWTKITLTIHCLIEAGEDIPGSNLGPEQGRSS